MNGNALVVMLLCLLYELGCTKYVGFLLSSGACQISRFLHSFKLEGL